VSNFAKEGRRNVTLNVSISTFVPKAHTPFMWAPQISFEESWRHINTIRNALKGGRVRVKWNKPELSWLEGIFSRGDRRLTVPLIEAWKSGARFDAWGEQFRIDIWREAFKRSELDPEFYLYRSRSADEILPWDHIGSGVKKDYLKREWRMAQEGKVTPDCREECLECGVCDHKEIDPVFCNDWSPSIVIDKGSFDRMGASKKYRLTFSKLGPAGYLSHLELARTFIRAFRRAGLKMVFSKGYHPMPKVSFASALPVGTESLHEVLDIELYETIPVSKLKNRLNRQLPDGLRVNIIEDIGLADHGRTLIESHFQVKVNGLKIDETYINKFLDSENFPVIKNSKKGNRVVNARSLVKDITYIPPKTLFLVMKHISGPEIKPIQIIQKIFHLKDHNMEKIKILKTKQVMG